MSTAVPTDFLISKFREHGYDDIEIEKAVPDQDVWDYLGVTWNNLFGWAWSQHPELKEHTAALQWDEIGEEAQCHFFYDTQSLFYELGNAIPHVIVADLADDLGIDPDAGGPGPSPSNDLASQLQAELSALGIDVLTEQDILGGEFPKGMFN